MATYTEIAAITSDEGWGGLLEKITVACAVKATEIVDSASPAAPLLAWAQATLAAPRAAAQAVAYYVIASNKAAAVTTILAASDTGVQSIVDDAVDALYGA